MPAARKVPGRRPPRRILVIDVGGTHVKFRIEPHGRTQKFDSGPKLGPKRMVRRILERLEGAPYDAVSIGYPGLVLRGRITAEPYNLGKCWTAFNFSAAFGVPVRIVNDAAMQAIGSYRGGRMLFLGLGTGLGATLIIDGVVEPTEIGHMPYRRGRTFEDYLGERGRERLGTGKWRREVARVAAQLATSLEADYVVLGGGNAARIKKLPHGVHRGKNRNAFIGGVRLWRGAGGR
ncbi:MAG TPA: ROK family protein [Steroidobacteraceae bacterium]|jgi:predicted NBD/HSP70 family sugar kinase|nr:ROK family protein [Steroidobacteraceae bacterium]